MIITTVKTPKVVANQISIFQLLDSTLTELHEQDIVVITSKIVSLCEGCVVPIGSVDKEQLIYQEADLYHIPGTDKHSTYQYTIVKNTFIPMAGIDESNGDGYYVLWPKDPIDSANQVRAYLRKRFKLGQVGVVITDSTIFPSRWGTMGIAIGHSGFAPINNYIGARDLFGRTLKVSKANVAGGLAAAAVLCMGEGAERTPIAVISDASAVEFHDTDPSPDECAEYYISPLDDQPFAPFFGSVRWDKAAE